MDLKVAHVVAGIRQGEVFGCIPHGARAYRERDSFALVVFHYGVTVSMTTISISSDPFVPACERHRGVKATFEDHGDWFLAVLRKTPGSEVARGGTLNGTLNGTLSGTLNASDRRVLEYIDANPGCRASAIIAETSIPRDTLNKIIARLAKSGKVERRGSKKTGGYYKL